jgi:hypothetical protein
LLACSVETKELKEYIHEHEGQTPCPFIMFDKNLPMEVVYDPAALNNESNQKAIRDLRSLMNPIKRQSEIAVRR